MTFQEAHPELFNGSVDTTQDVKPFSNETGNSNVSPVATYQGTMTAAAPVDNYTTTTTPVINNTNTTNYDSGNSNNSTNSTSNNTQPVVNYDPKPFENETINKNETFENRGLSEKQQSELQNLVKNKPADTWTQTDWNNYNYAMSLTNSQKEKASSLINEINTINSTPKNQDVAEYLADKINTDTTSKITKISDYNTSPKFSNVADITPEPTLSTAGLEKYLTDAEKIIAEQNLKREEYYAKMAAKERQYVYDLQDNLMSLNDKEESYRLYLQSMWDALDYNSIIKNTNELNSRRIEDNKRLVEEYKKAGTGVAGSSARKSIAIQIDGLNAMYDTAINKPVESVQYTMTPIYDFYDKQINGLEKQKQTLISTQQIFEQMWYNDENNLSDAVKDQKEILDSAISQAKKQKDAMEYCYTSASYNNAFKYYGLSPEDDWMTMYRKIAMAERDDAIKTNLRNAYPDIQAGMEDSLDEWFNALLLSPKYLQSLKDIDAETFINARKNGDDVATAFTKSMNTSGKGLYYEYSSNLTQGADAAKAIINSKYRSDLAKIESDKIDNDIENGQSFSAYSKIYQQAYNNLGSTEKQQFDAAYKTIMNLTDDRISTLNGVVKEGLDNYADKFKGLTQEEIDVELENDARNWVKTNFNRLLNAMGISSPDELSQEQLLQFENFYVQWRKNITGVQFSEKEDKAYRAIFVGANDSPELQLLKTRNMLGEAYADQISKFTAQFAGNQDLAERVLFNNAYKEYTDSIFNDYKIEEKNNGIFKDVKDANIVNKLIAVKTIQTIHQDISIPINSDDINQYDGGQCGTFIGDLLAYPLGSRYSFKNEYEGKIKDIEKLGGTAEVNDLKEHTYKTGDIIVINTGTEYGHIAMVDYVYDDGSFSVLESNYNLNERITNNRRITNTDNIGAVLPVDVYDEDKKFRTNVLKQY